MRILYFIGNGLDVSLGMKTRYPDFYEYYCSLDENMQDRDVIRLRNSIEQGKEDWKDLEYQLGQYTKDVSNAEALERICLNLNDELRNYLLKEQDKVQSEDFDRNRCIDQMVHPEQFLLSMDQDEVYRSLPDPSTRSISFITLNYTDTLEKILFNGKNGISDKGRDETGRSWSIVNLFHAHGTLEGTPLIGVDNPSQIANTELAAIEDVREILVKTEANASIKSGVDRRCKELIGRADLIILFGVSLGETDETWWREIGKRIKTSNAVVIIFHYDPKMNLTHHDFLMGRFEREVRESFIKRSECGGKEKERRNQIYVVLNKPLFGGVKKTG